MKIEVEPQTMIRLMGYSHASRGKEFSGLGFCELKGEVIWIYDFVVLDVGSEVFTEIPVSELMKLMDRPDYKNMKVWIHMHPMGDGVPGKHNWSGTDEATIQQTPLGGLPELVKWSVSMVLTLGGWVGRIDNYQTRKTLHLEVTPSIQPCYADVKAIVGKKEATGRAELEQKVAAITDRVGELDLQVLEDLGITREELLEMALEQAGLYDSGEAFISDLDYYDLEVDAPAAGQWHEYDTYPSRGSKQKKGRSNYAAY